MCTGEEIMLLPFWWSLKFLFDLMSSVELYIMPLVWCGLAVTNIHLFPYFLDNTDWWWWTCIPFDSLASLLSVWKIDRDLYLFLVLIESKLQPVLILISCISYHSLGWLVDPSITHSAGCHSCTLFYFFILFLDFNYLFEKEKAE